jgi:hypothetical protein
MGLVTRLHSKPQCVTRSIIDAAAFYVLIGFYAFNKLGAPAG